MKIFFTGQLTTETIYTGTKDFKIFLPGLEPEKVESHCSRVPKCILYMLEIPGLVKT